MVRSVLARSAVLIFVLLCWTKRAEAQPCNLALVLAIDVSGSVDAGEYVLQIEGLAMALRSPEVAEALTAVGQGTVLVTVMHWSGNGQQVQVVPWTRILDRTSVLRLASEIVRVPRQFDKYSTAIGEALRYANRRILELPSACRRLVIDVTGDGRSNEGWSPHLIRDQLVAQGITINALAILANDPNLLGYFQKHVIGGAGSFVMSADRFEDYPEAIKRKLIREILPPVVQQDRAPAIQGGQVNSPATWRWRARVLR